MSETSKKIIDHIPLVDLDAQFKAIEQEIRDAVERVYKHKRFIMGPEVKKLEQKLAQYCGVDHAIGCASGSDALLLSLMAVDIKPGDYVITSPFTFFATAGAIARLGAKPVFLDINPLDYNINPAELDCFMEGKHPLNARFPYWQEKTKAVIPVHLYGQMADMEPIRKIANKHDLFVIEDAAQAIGAIYQGKKSGSLGHTGCFSFFPSKNLGCFGDGGLITTNDEAVAEKLNILRLHGAKPKYHHSLVGINSRLDTIQAAILLVKLQYIDKWNSRRRENAAFYTKTIHRHRLSKIEIDGLQDYSSLKGNNGCLDGEPDKVVEPIETTGAQERSGKHVYHQYVIKTERRDELKKVLDKAQIGNSIYYPVPLHQQECFRNLGYKADDCPVASCAARQTLALPMFPELTEARQKHVIETIASFLG